MSARWALLIVFLLAAWGARADLGHKSFTPVVPVGPLVQERAEPIELDDTPRGRVRGPTSDDEDVVFDSRGERSFRSESLNSLQLDEEDR